MDGYETEGGSSGLVEEEAAGGFVFWFFFLEDLLVFDWLLNNCFTTESGCVLSGVALVGG